MLVVATFEYSLFIELAIASLEQSGIAKEEIFSIPLEARTEPRQLFDTIHRADGINMFDVAAMLGTCFMLLGSIYGYVLTWGPIIWGLIGAITGILTGFIIKFLLIKKSKANSRKIISEVVIMIRCDENHWQTVNKILWDHSALRVAKILD